mmetsp:Transcript_2989/g.8458  ORF Transcript_2989/g.8458 Transcript_2989/m.8458 type:complete len:362 (+) Transcript_2989:364-1449(+)
MGAGLHGSLRGLLHLHDLPRLGACRRRRHRGRRHVRALIGLALEPQGRERGAIVASDDSLRLHHQSERVPVAEAPGGFGAARYRLRLRRVDGAHVVLGRHDGCVDQSDIAAVDTPPFAHPVLGIGPLPDGEQGHPAVPGGVRHGGHPFGLTGDGRTGDGHARLPALHVAEAFPPKKAELLRLPGVRRLPRVDGQEGMAGHLDRRDLAHHARILLPRTRRLHMGLRQVPLRDLRRPVFLYLFGGEAYPAHRLRGRRRQLGERCLRLDFQGPLSLPHGGFRRRLPRGLVGHRRRHDHGTYLAEVRGAPTGAERHHRRNAPDHVHIDCDRLPSAGHRAPGLRVVPGLLDRRGGPIRQGDFVRRH